MILLPLTSLMSGGRLTSLSVMLEARSGFLLLSLLVPPGPSVGRKEVCFFLRTTQGFVRDVKRMSGCKGSDVSQTKRGIKLFATNIPLSYKI